MTEQERIARVLIKLCERPEIPSEGPTPVDLSSVYEMMNVIEILDMQHNECTDDVLAALFPIRQEFPQRLRRLRPESRRVFDAIRGLVSRSVSVEERFRHG